MIRKGRLLKNTAIALAIISVFGSSLSSVSAAEIVKNTPAITQYVNGSYGVDLSILKENTQETSNLNNFYASAKVEISNNKMYMIINFKSNPMIQTLQAKINGETVLDLDDSITTVKFEISSLSDNISLYVEINTGVMGVMKHNCDVRIDKAEIPTVSDEEATDNESKEDISITLRHLTEDKNSSGHKYLQSSQLKTVNGKKYIVMTFESGSMFTSMQASINGKDVESTFVKDEANDIATVEFEISSLSDYMELSFSYNTPIGSMTHSARIQTSENVNAVKPEEEEKDDAVTSPTPGTGSGSTSQVTNTYKNGYYQLKNILHLDNPTGYAMVRNLLSETTNMEVKNGKTYITLRMSMASQMSNINIKVDGKNANFTKTNIGNDTLEFKIEVPSTSSKLTFSMFIAAMGQNVDFKISFDESTIKFISSNEEPTIPNTGTTTDGSTTGGLTSTDTDLKVESSAVKGKLYTIQNQIISSSSTGQQMARKYTSSTTKIEEIDGKMYATLTFTGVDLMSNHKIYVNGSVVSHSITSKTSSSVSLRFAIPNVNADIKVQAYIIPMGSTVTYGVKLLESTLKFVKDFEIANGTLPQTGSLINSEAVMATGGLLAMSGVLLRRKRK